LKWPWKYQVSKSVSLTVVFDMNYIQNFDVSNLIEYARLSSNYPRLQICWIWNFRIFFWFLRKKSRFLPKFDQNNILRKFKKTLVNEGFNQQKRRWLSSTCCPWIPVDYRQKRRIFKWPLWSPETTNSRFFFSRVLTQPMAQTQTTSTFEVCGPWNSSTTGLQSSGLTNFVVWNAHIFDHTYISRLY
jgi:hypothetical protein